ncbi:MAG TPA: amino acid ABC transporter permease [Syntrophales bacterium]|jgi:polar amino acid transport system permease protein|nr:amino acid ABC transporter permease [Syntrophales bacterium]HRT62422.1 amino acid ABC transporter permease [Syntrophales bacterium]
MDQWFGFKVIWDNIEHFLIGRYPSGPIGGLTLTIWLAVVSCSLSIIIGIVLGLLCVSQNRIIRYPVLAVVNCIRGIPLLMVIFWMYFLLPAFMGTAVPESWTIVAALTVFTSAYMSQIVQAGIEAIPRGQLEAGLSTGLSRTRVMVYIILPQALRNMIPSFVNQLVSLIKDTSLAFIVGVAELTHVATQVNNRTMIYPAQIFFFIAVVYFILCFMLTSYSRWLEQRLAYRKAI